MPFFAREDAPLSSMPEFPIDLADRCVMCGLCIPHCPTYALTRNENESPRGRIALMQGLARGQLEPDASSFAHLDHCLECRACESVCPSRVPYGRLLDDMRAQLRQNGRRTRRSVRWLLTLLGGTPARLRRWSNYLYLYQRLGLQRLTATLGYLGSRRLRRLNRLLPVMSRPEAPITLHPANVRVETLGKVQLFTGCASRLLDRQTREAAVYLLTRLGYVVNIPQQQVCCGALHRHEGESALAAQLAEHNLQAFDKREGPILSLASGCSSHLSEYPLTTTDWRAEGFSERAEDITGFLARARWPERLQFAPLEGKVAVHEPCLQRNVLKQSFHTYALLQKIPRLEVVPLTGNELCCGAAGSQMISQPEQADALLTPKLAAARDMDVTYLVSTNIGCALHLAAGLREQGQEIEVLHPLTLLARQLRTQ
ncbi:MAG: (Fe-S)-binding protein [Gammaproteobacteria bacterium]|nr:(Fe-S)-binding protein [Gammaproteobacteria bacterium]